MLKEVLAKQIKSLAYRGVTDWLSGMAQGVDLWCAQIVLGLKEKTPPCTSTASSLISRTYHSDCMLERNHYMVDRASILLAVYNGTCRSGTGVTVRCALKMGREVIIIDPISRNITRRG